MNEWMEWMNEKLFVKTATLNYPVAQNTTMQYFTQRASKKHNYMQC